jgi:hypothetical protein
LFIKNGIFQIIIENIFLSLLILLIIFKDELTSSITELKLLLNQHNKLMNDIKPLLKMMNKVFFNNMFKVLIYKII